VKHKRGWSSQPVEVEDHEILCDFFHKGLGQVVEIRKGYFVTVGNLFGSQTIKVPNADTALRIIDALSKLPEDGEIELKNFPGCEIIEAPVVPIS